MKKQQRYTPEFGAEAVKLVTEQGLLQKEAAKWHTPKTSGSFSMHSQGSTEKTFGSSYLP